MPSRRICDYNEEKDTRPKSCNGFLSITIAVKKLNCRDKIQASITNTSVP